MAGAVLEADTIEGVERFPFVGHAVEVLRQHHILDRREIRDHVKLLKNESDGFRAYTGKFGGGELRDILPIQPDLAARRTVEAADEIDQSALARAGGTHYRDPFARGDGERNIVERFDEAEAAAIFFCPGGITPSYVVELNHRRPLCLL